MDKPMEDQMLIHALQHPQDDVWMHETKRLCLSTLNWSMVFQRGVAVGLGPLLYRQLRCVADELNIPEEELDHLRDEYLENLAKNAYRGLELKRILQTFRGAGLAAILLKGASLCEAVYQDPGARIYGDLDILVPKKKINLARDLLCSIGYQAKGAVEIQEHYRKHHHHLAPMVHPEKSVVVELHWNVNPRIHVDIDSWWKRSVLTEIQGMPVRILGCTDMLLHLCLHLFSSGDTRNSLRGLVDIYRVLIHAGQAIDWAIFNEQTKCYGIQKEGYAVLQTTKHIMDPQGSSTVWPETMPAPPSLVTQMAENVFSMEKKRPFPGSLLAFQTESSWVKKIALLKRHFFPTAAEMNALYNVAGSSWKIYLYYCIRPIQLFWRYGSFTRHLLGTK